MNRNRSRGLVAVAIVLAVTVAGCIGEEEEAPPEEPQVVFFGATEAWVGDLVEFELSGHTELKVSLIVWAVPLAGLILGAVAGAGFYETIGLDRDPATLLGALLGLAVAFLAVLAFERRAKGDERLLPHILKVVNPSSCPTGPEEKAKN